MKGKYIINLKVDNKSPIGLAKYADGRSYHIETKSFTSLETK